jgi:hypothetical protein
VFFNGQTRKETGEVCSASVQNKELNPEYESHSSKIQPGKGLSLTDIIDWAIAGMYIEGVIFTNVKTPEMKKTMQTKLNWLVWVDHRKAILMHTDAEGNILSEEISSHVGERERFRGEGSDKTGLFGQSLSHEKNDQARENNHFKSFLKSVVQKFEKPESILILGPGDARFELQNMIEKEKAMSGVTVVTKAADKMTMPMLKAALLEEA